MKSRSLLVTAAFLLPTAACSSTSDSPTPTVASSASSTETEPAIDGPTIPAGLFEKSITRKDVEKVGVEPQEIHFSPEGNSLGGVQVRRRCVDAVLGTDRGPSSIAAPMEPTTLTTTGTWSCPRRVAATRFSPGAGMARS